MTRDQKAMMCISWSNKEQLGEIKETIVEFGGEEVVGTAPALDLTPALMCLC